MSDAQSEHHDFVYSQNLFADEPYSIFPECSCGWMGRGVATVEDAKGAWDNHHETGGEGDGSE